MPSLSNAVGSLSVLEQLAEKDSPIHRLHPSVKILVSIIYVASVISFGRYDLSGLMPYVFYPAVIMALAELPVRPLLKRLALVLPFCILAGLSNIFFDTETALIWGDLQISFGFISFLSIVSKAVLSSAAVMILVATTPAAELYSQLLRFKVPHIIVMQLAMTYRYISVLTEEASTMYTSYVLRSPKRKGIMIKDMGVFLGQLVLRSIDRAQRVYLAMKCRGYNGVFGHSSKKKTRITDLFYFIVIVFFIILCRFVNLSNLIGRVLV